MDSLSVAHIGEEDGTPGDVTIAFNGREGLSIIGGYVELANTTIEDNGGFAAVFVSEGVLEMGGGTRSASTTSIPARRTRPCFSRARHSNSSFPRDRIA